MSAPSPTTETHENVKSVEYGPVSSEPPTPPSRLKIIKDKFQGTFKFSLFFWMVIHLTMLVTGAVHFNNCPVEENIPIFLIVYGSVGLVSRLITILRNVIIRHIKLSSILSLIVTLELLFFILGAYWVYKEYEPSYNPYDGNLYCNKTAYLVAFIYISASIAVLLLALIGLACFLCALYAMERMVDSHAEEEAKASNTATASQNV